MSAVFVGNHPVIFSELNRCRREGKEFAAPQSTTNQKSNDRMVPLAPETIALGAQQQRTALIGSEPVAQSYADPTHASDSPDTSRKLWTE